MERLAIIWEGETVGFIQDAMPDMWYLEGKWLPGDGPKTEDFLRAARDLDPKTCIEERTGVPVEIVEAELAEGVGKPTPALVMAPPGELIFVRRMYPGDAQGKPLVGTFHKRGRWSRLWHKLTGG